MNIARRLAPAVYDGMHRVANQPQDMIIWEGIVLMARCQSGNEHLKNGARYKVLKIPKKRDETLFELAQGDETVVDPQGSRSVDHLWTRGRIRSFGAHHIHRVGNDGNVPAVSLHAYRPALAEMRRFRTAVIDRI